MTIHVEYYREPQIKSLPIDNGPEHLSGGREPGTGLQQNQTRSPRALRAYKTTGNFSYGTPRPKLVGHLHEDVGDYTSKQPPSAELDSESSAQRPKISEDQSQRIFTPLTLSFLVALSDPLS